MKILKIQVLRGPNIWSNYRQKLIQVRLDLEEMENFPTDKIEGFPQRLMEALPTMIAHECSEGCRGGFFTRLKRGTWLGHVIEHVALEIQTLAGMEVGYGRTRGTAVKGVYNMVFAYEVEQAGRYAAEAAFRIVDAIARNQPYDLASEIEQLNILYRRYGLGPSTKSIVEEAVKRGIPWQRLGTQSKIQLGYGKNQQRFQATMTSKTAASAVSIAGDKDETKALLKQASIPVAAGDICTTIESMEDIIKKIGFPVVLKPLNGNHGKGASVNIVDLTHAHAAFAHAKTFGQYVMVEKFIPGHDYRVLVIDGKFVAASRRVPATVIGDGVLNIFQLIENINNDPARGDGHEAVLTRIAFDQDTKDQLEKAGLNYNDIPASGEAVVLKSTANLSTGGTAVDETDHIHPYNKFMAERIAKIIGLDICGIDMMASTLTRPLTEIGGVILEVNAAPGFRMHLAPAEGQPRNAAAAVVDMLYPEGTASRIPIFAVTGTNGKTTTTRLLAHITRTAGYNTGFTTTDGIYIGDHKIKSGDTTGPLSAQLLLQDPTVDFAVLETARGGLLRGGLSYDYCDAGIITNIQEDHLGLNDINNLDDLANVKGVVVRSVKKSGWAILNAEDQHCINLAKDLDCNIAFFARNVQNPVIAKHVQEGKVAIVLDGDLIVLKEGSKTTVVENVRNIPLTLNGTAKFMIDNVMAAAVTAYTHGFSLSLIQGALQSFVPSYELTPGRMNLFHFEHFKVLVDYAHNPHGLLAMKEYLRHLEAKRTVGIIAGIGDRRDQDIVEVGTIAATMFDHVIVRQEHGLRGRTVAEINSLIVKGLLIGNSNMTYDLVPDEEQAIAHALKIAQPGDYIIALSDGHEKVVKIIKQAQQEEMVLLPHSATGKLAV